MNTAKTWTLTFAVFLTAGTIASAASVDWNADPAAQVLAQVRRMEAKTPLPAMASFAGKTGAAAERLQAKPVDSDALQYEDSGDAEPGDEQTTLNLNDAKDRVGALFSDCSNTYSDDSSPQSCDTLQFVFPMLTVDKANHLILDGSEVVAKWSSHFLLGTNVKLAAGWRLVVAKKKTMVTVDDGFDHHQAPHTTIAIYLQKN
ncbi:MAG: hypothetical protein KGI84_09520 [Elusimicrobia bacterium]|nr:hypothetical protein [Elusimicrobiota bacterium]